MRVTVATPVVLDAAVSPPPEAAVHAAFSAAPAGTQRVKASTREVRSKSLRASVSFLCWFQPR
jgi:hypothetical protein